MLACWFDCTVAVARFRALKISSTAVATSTYSEITLSPLVMVTFCLEVAYQDRKLQKWVISKGQNGGQKTQKRKKKNAGTKRRINI